MASDSATENGLKAVETLRAFLTKMQLNPQEEAFPQGKAFTVELEGPTEECVTQIMVEKERFIAHFNFKGIVPEELRMKVSEFITRANYGLIIGNFELNIGTGKLRYKSSIDFSSAELAEPLIRNAMLSSMDNIEVFAGALGDLLDGDMEPEEAYQAARDNLASTPRNDFD
ncbi:MAG TPA: hypothetical protein VFB82_24085 [Blastocatellia bacterium]|jgi:hypothetical protein|nr:hypothetical protein [Blastocatellia bacterium]